MYHPSQGITGKLDTSRVVVKIGQVPCGRKANYPLLNMSIRVYCPDDSPTYLPTKVAIMHIKGHGKTKDAALCKGNWLEDKASKTATIKGEEFAMLAFTGATAALNNVQPKDTEMEHEKAQEYQARKMLNSWWLVPGWKIFVPRALVSHIVQDMNQHSH